MKYPYILFYHRVLPKNIYAFERQIRLLKYSKNIIDISEIEDLKRNTIIITFDDGYYDNFVFAYPILKKYNVKATIFVTTSKMLNTPPRKNLFDYWEGKVSFKELIDNNNEFLSWEELNIMKNSGLINIQAHSHTHSSHFTSYYFVNKPQRKIGYLNIEWKQDKFYKIKSQFVDVEYIPSEQRFETVEERERRLSIEFEQPKKLIDYYLGYIPKHFCWPWGEYDDYALQLGKKYGYKYFYTTERKLICDKIDYNKIPRISSSFNYFTFLKRNFLYPNKFFAKILRLC